MTRQIRRCNVQSRGQESTLAPIYHSNDEPPILRVNHPNLVWNDRINIEQNSTRIDIVASNRQMWLIINWSGMQYRKPFTECRDMIRSRKRDSDTLEVNMANPCAAPKSLTRTLSTPLLSGTPLCSPGISEGDRSNDWREIKTTVHVWGWCACLLPY